MKPHTREIHYSGLLKDDQKLKKILRDFHIVTDFSIVISPSMMSILSYLQSYKFIVSELDIQNIPNLHPFVLSHHFTALGGIDGCSSPIQILPSGKVIISVDKETSEHCGLPSTNLKGKQVESKLVFADLLETKHRREAPPGTTPAPRLAWSLARTQGSLRASLLDKELATRALDLEEATARTVRPGVQQRTAGQHAGDASALRLRVLEATGYRESLAPHGTSACLTWSGQGLLTSGMGVLPIVRRVQASAASSSGWCLITAVSNNKVPIRRAAVMPDADSLVCDEVVMLELRVMGDCWECTVVEGGIER